MTKNQCCDAWGKAHEIGTDNEGCGELIYEIDGHSKIGYGLPPIRFCPWCGAPKDKSGFDETTEPSP